MVLSCFVICIHYASTYGLRGVFNMVVKYDRKMVSPAKLPGVKVVDTPESLEYPMPLPLDKWSNSSPKTMARKKTNAVVPLMFMSQDLKHRSVKCSFLTVLCISLEAHEVQECDWKLWRGSWAHPPIDRLWGQGHWVLLVRWPVVARGCSERGDHCGTSREGPVIFNITAVMKCRTV